MGKRFRRIAALSITGAVVAGGAGTAYAAASSPAPAYRLATVTSAHVTASLAEVGTLTPVRQADVPFSVGGTVQTVAVQPGQHVTAGQVLGSLDTTPLKAGLTAAQSALANANLQVANDTASQDTAATASAASPASSPGSRPAPSLGPLQSAVLSAQRQADGSLAQARTALGQAKAACAAPPAPSPTVTPAAATSTAVAAAATAAGTTHRSPAVTPSPATCSDATQRVLDAETAVLHAQQALSGRLTALAAALSSAAAAASPSPGGGTSPAMDGGDRSITLGDSGGGPAGPAGPASAAQLAADQAAADAAAAQVTVAQQNLAAGTVASPISGTVVSVSVTPGSTATPGAAAFVIAGLDTYQVLTEVPVTDLPQLKVGQRASVQPDGLSTPLTGSVVSIGLIPDSTGSTVTYPVTIGLTGPASGLHPGGYASVMITTAQARGASVPTSAVHKSGHQATVTVYAGGRTRVARVTVGTMGPVMTRITAGLRTGQQVVLANLNAPLPTNNLTNRFAGLGGPGFGGSVNFIGPAG
jgi:multidrug efflux pump subunit AcrA (membrane-fusion protein)